MTKDVYSKNPIVFKVFLDKIPEFLLRHRISSLGVTFLLMLLLIHCSAKKQSSKKDLILLIGPNNFEIVFILLEETIAV